MKNKISRPTQLLTLLLTALLLTLLFFNFHSSEKETLKLADHNVSAETETQTILTGKKMLAFGDSVTEFGNYPTIIADNTGMTVQNMGFKGTRLSYHPNSYYAPFSLTKLIDAIISGDFSEQDLAIQEDRNYSRAFKQHYEDVKTIDLNQVDIISIFLGTNDYASSQSSAVFLGTPTDTDRETFYGAINYFVQTIQKEYPHLELVFITPTWRMNHEDMGGKSASEQPNLHDIYLTGFVDAWNERGDYYNIPTLDLYRTSGLNEENHADYFKDHVHPNKKGYELIGNTISHFLIEAYNE